ncbi:MAG: hypothetical protein RSC05_13205 [Acinetobacter sp.]
MNKDWGVYEYHESAHVVPINDIKEHSLEDCKCGVKYDDGVYVHNSYDGRELLEEAEAKGSC